MSEGEASKHLILNWTSPGPVSSAFMRSRRPVSILNGPIGSGKTSTNFMYHIRRAIAQRPSTLDGVRKYKLCVVRDTYRQLWATTIPSWHKWVGKGLGTWNGGKNEPCSHEVEFEVPGLGIVRLTVDFVALGENSVEDVLRGYEPTAFYLNEGDLLARDVLNYARGRAGRYPGMLEGGPSWYGVTIDANAPELDSWLYDILMDPPEDFGVFVQPGGRQPDAENLSNLPPGYYDTQVSSNDPAYVDRMVDNKPGYSRDGKPVYPEFNDNRHVAKEKLKPIPGLPIQLALDAGLSPAAVAGQRLANGQWRILRELAADHGTGPRRFAKNLAQWLADEFPGFQITEGFADPAAFYGGDKESEEDRAWAEIVEAVAKIRLKPAPGGNVLGPRLDAVRGPLRETIDGTTPAFLLSSCCKVLRRGFNNGYRFRKIQTTDGRYADAPAKTAESHPHDALQYLLLGGGEYEQVMGRDRAHRERRRQTHAITDGRQGGGNPRERRPYDRQRGRDD